MAEAARCSCGTPSHWQRQPARPIRGPVPWGSVFDVDVLSNGNIAVGVNSGAAGQLLVREETDARNDGSLGPAPGTPGGGTSLGPITEDGNGVGGNGV